MLSANMFSRANELDFRRKVLVDSQEVGFDNALLVVAEMLYAHLPEEAVVVAIDNMRVEHAQLNASRAA